MSKDVKSSSAVLPKGVRGQAAASITRSVVVDKNGLETDDDVPTPSPSLPAKLTNDDLLAFYRSSSKKGIVHKRIQSFHGSLNPTDAATATPFNLGDVAQGDDPRYERLGLQTRADHLKLRFRCQWAGDNAAGTTSVIWQALLSPVGVRIVVFWDKMPLLAGSTTSVEPSVIWAEDALTPGGMGAMTLTGLLGTSGNTVAPFNPNTHGTRYEILHDEVIRPQNLNNGQNGGGVSLAVSANQFNFERYIDLKNRKQTYYTTTASSVIDNCLYMFVIRDIMTTGAAPVTYNFTADFQFTDVQQ